MPNFSFPIGSVLKAITVCQVPGQVSTNQHKWQMTQITGATDFQSTDFITTYDAAMAALYVVLLANTATYYGTMLYLMNPVGVAPRPDDTKINVTTGTGGVALLPTQTSGLISLYSAVLGKTGQGRTYVPFPSPDASSNDGTPTVAYNADLDSLGNFLSTDVVITVGPVTARFAPVIYPGGATPIKFITGFKARDAWATQRRRGSFGKTNSLPF